MRHPAQDYSQAGAYFVTICLRRNAGVLLSRVQRDVNRSDVKLTLAGQILERVWQGIPARYPRVLVDRHVVMPDHFHGVIIVKNADAPAAIEEMQGKELERRSARRRKMLLPKIIGYLKMNASKEINLVYRRKGKLWLRSYHDQIIRDVEHLENVRRYIESNPEKWQGHR